MQILSIKNLKDTNFKSVRSTKDKTQINKSKFLKKILQMKIKTKNSSRETNFILKYQKM